MRDWKKWPIKEKNIDEWPEGLNKIKPAIKKIYYRGEWTDEVFNKSLAIVGSRRMTRYGREMTEKLVIDLVANGVTIVSGFMYGVDSQAHRKTIEFGGKTVAVLGGGLNFLTPAENDDLYSQILESGGLVISEYEADFRPSLWTFPQRNRIVAGLVSIGVVVVEASLKSGSLITARLARNQGKKVWAIPGMINLDTSKGTNYLIKNSLATILTETEDIVNLDRKAVQENLFDLGLEKIEMEVVKKLKTEASTIDELTRELDREVGEVSAAISNLTLKGLVEEEAGKIFLLR